MKRVLLLKPGVTSSRALLGDYEAWFAQRCAGAATFVPVEVHAGERVPALDGFDAVIMTGSPRSVTQPEPWMERAADAMLDAAARARPVLGVCFGHQLLAWRLGGGVVRNPAGRELGTITVTLTEAGQDDRLFARMPQVIEVQSTHEDMVAPLPPEAVCLASSERCAVQAFRWGESVRGVQFHPEMDRASTQYCVRDPVMALNDSERERIHAAVHDTPFGEQLLRNFLAA